MAESIHPVAPHHLPGFITAPGETDILFNGSVVFLVVLLFLVGSLYFWLHSLPERIAHGTSKLQFQLVAVLALLALFTHINAFWVAALLIALVPIPDFWTPLATMADSLRRLAGGKPRFAASDQVPPTPDHHETASDPANAASQMIAPAQSPPHPVAAAHQEPATMVVQGRDPADAQTKGEHASVPDKAAEPHRIAPVGGRES